MTTLTRLAALPLATALVVIALKLIAWRLTSSVALLSDALESLVNVASGVVTLVFINLASQPPDEEHAYGHTKAEYFASGIVGGLVVFAALSTAVVAAQRLAAPRPPEQVETGLGLTLLATALNAGLGLALLYLGRQRHSIALEAEGHHLLTDVWTSLGAVAGLGLSAATGWHWLDPVVALVIAANIGRAGWRLLRQSADGLLDVSIAPPQLQRVRAVLDSYASEGVSYHALRTRQAASRCFISVHVLVPAHWTVKEGHMLLERLEADLRAAVPHATIFTHLEPAGEPSAMEDQALDRPQRPSTGKASLPLRDSA
ncbi:MAG: cation diffusion facilitator family transporter [Anaerolineae bacterium]|nr:cation diffusion facilitator family transporter [Thermoflexales bacterium]MDW8395114.1 cation diffusion facilitator family transporter [Anaerolineae bacterium]